MIPNNHNNETLDRITSEIQFNRATTLSILPTNAKVRGNLFYVTCQAGFDLNTHPLEEKLTEEEKRRKAESQSPLLRLKDQKNAPLSDTYLELTLPNDKQNHRFQLLNHTKQERGSFGSDSTKRANASVIDLDNLTYVVNDDEKQDDKKQLIDMTVYSEPSKPDEKRANQQRVIFPVSSKALSIKYAAESEFQQESFSMDKKMGTDPASRLMQSVKTNRSLEVIVIDVDVFPIPEGFRLRNSPITKLVLIGKNIDAVETAAKRLLNAGTQVRDLTLQVKEKVNGKIVFNVDIFLSANRTKAPESIQLTVPELKTLEACQQSVNVNYQSQRNATILVNDNTWNVHQRQLQSPDLIVRSKPGGDWQRTQLHKFGEIIRKQIKRLRSGYPFCRFFYIGTQKKSDSINEALVRAATFSQQHPHIPLDVTAFLHLRIMDADGHYQKSVADVLNIPRKWFGDTPLFGQTDSLTAVEKEVAKAIQPLPTPRL